MNQKLVIIRGGPASGKSTICEAIQRKDRQIVWLQIDSFKRFVDTGNEDSDREYWYGAAAASLDYFFTKGFSVIAECIFQNLDHVELFVNTARINNIPYKVFEFVVDHSKLHRRDSTRPGVSEGLRQKLDKEVITRLSTLVKENHFEEAEIIDTDKFSVNDVIEKVYKEFKNE